MRIIIYNLRLCQSIHYILSTWENSRASYYMRQKIKKNYWNRNIHLNTFKAITFTYNTLHIFNVQNSELQFNLANCKAIKRTKNMRNNFNYFCVASFFSFNTTIPKMVINFFFIHFHFWIFATEFWNFPHCRNIMEKFLFHFKSNQQIN